MHKRLISYVRSLRYVFVTKTRQTYAWTCLIPFDFELFGPSLLPSTMTSADFSQFALLRTILPSMRPHGISRLSFLVYLPNLLTWGTIAFWTSLLYVSLSAMQALILGFCSSGYDFAIASSRPHLAM